MAVTDITEFLAEHPVVLGEGAVIERLRRDGRCPLDPQVVNSAFIYHAEQREALAAIYRGYLSVGEESGLPLLLSTPTWRASRDRIAAAGLAERDVNGDNFRFIDGLRRACGGYARQVLICGLLSCRNNAYAPGEALDVSVARHVHSWQAERLAATDADFLLAATLPALREALGLALALAACGKPYMISFVVRRSGTLLDGTPLREAVAAIDEGVSPPPVAYLVNCSHASVFRAALTDSRNAGTEVRRRVIGLLANTAALEPEELDERAELVGEEPDEFGRGVAALHHDFALSILGGCCGTDERHIRALARQLRR